MRSCKVYSPSYTATVKLFCATTTGVSVLQSFGSETSIHRRKRNVAAIGFSFTFFLSQAIEGPEQDIILNTVLRYSELR